MRDVRALLRIDSALQGRKTYQRMLLLLRVRNVLRNVLLLLLCEGD
jgi:hypothetical protein